MIAEFEEKRHMLLESFKDEKKIDEENHKKILHDMRQQIFEQKHMFENDLNELKKNHDLEMKQIYERNRIEKEEWQKKYMAKIEAEINEQEVIFK